MSKKEPFQEEYGRHSNFRPARRPESDGLPYAKVLLVVFALALAVIGYDRWRGKAGRVSAAVQTAQSPAAQPEKPAPEALEPPMDRPATALAETAAPIRIRPPDEAPAQEDENPFTVAQYVMEKNPHSNSFMGLAAVNGQEVTVLADTGASVVVIPENIAQRIGLKKGAEMTFRTGGGVVPHYATTLDTLTLGQIELRNVEAAINPAMQEDFILLGMNALGVLDMHLERGKLVLKHAQQTAAHELTSVEPFKRSAKDCANHGNKFDQQTLDCLKGK